jgi:hypothetical protein
MAFPGKGKMAELKAGFGLDEITPLVGTPMSGYFKARYVSGVNDPLLVRALALSDGTTDVILLTYDLLSMENNDVAAIREAVSKVTGVDPDNIWTFCTHTHTGPSMAATFGTPRADDYAAEIPAKSVRAAKTAWLDIAPAEVKLVSREVPGVAFERRFKMKDGTVRTNPGVGNPDIVEPMREISTPLTMLAFERDPTRLDIVLAHYPVHADMTSGTIASADYAGRLCNDLTHELPGHPEALFIRGPAGDINHVDVNGTERQGGIEFVHGVAQILTKAALAMWDDRADVTGALTTTKAKYTLERRAVTEEEARMARNRSMRPNGTDSDLSDDELWAREVVLLSQMDMELERESAVLTIGDVALAAVPGELFSELGEQIVAGSPHSFTFVSDCANGKQGYLPAIQNYDQQGYEERPARSSPHAPGSGEKVVEETIKLFKR